jgi:hypothetical protein
MTIEEQLALRVNALERRLADVERLAGRRDQKVIYNAAHGNAGTTSGTTPSLMSSFPTSTLVARGVPGSYFVLATAYIVFTTSGDVFEFSIMVGSTEYGNVRINVGTDGNNFATSGFIPHDGVTTFQVDLKLTRTGGTGTAQFFGTDPRYMQFHAIWIPS